MAFTAVTNKQEIVYWLIFQLNQSEGLEVVQESSLMVY